MPELPEVECVARSLRPVLLGRTVTEVAVRRRGVVTAPADPPGGWTRTVAQAAPAPLPGELLLLRTPIAAIERYGKQLALLGPDPSTPALVVQLGMTGQLLHCPPAAEASHPISAGHVHVVWTLDDGARLGFRDPRRFGRVRAFGTADALRAAQRACLGPDALSIDARTLAHALGASTSPIKARLLDQSVIAGLGNIYADEALHAAGIGPWRPAGSLSVAEHNALAGAIRTILAAAIEAGGSTLRDYRDSTGAPGTFQHRHAVYGRAGAPCRRCGRPLLGDRLGGRATVWCGGCQQ
jgi:formamidopyrimidine-DNA glycosylase